MTPSDRQHRLHDELAAQVVEAARLLLAGFERAAQRDAGPGRTDWLRAALDAPRDHLYRGVLGLVLRLVFILHAEDHDLLPVGHPIYSKHLGVQGLYSDLLADATARPESMHHRFGAYARLLALSRAIFRGVRRGDLVLPPRHGRLFDPSTYPFLEGGAPGSTPRAEVRPPPVDDGVIYAVLRRLRDRPLDVEQLGATYESLVGFHVARAAEGHLVLQPGDARRHFGSHYTPRALTERIVRRTLEPLLAGLGAAPTADQLLALKVCDPAMGSGAFLVEVCRQLADHLVAAWTRAGARTEAHGDAHLHARRLVAQRCVYGVDKDEVAVELARLSLWLVTRSRELPFTFVDHALRHGDSLVGLDLAQLAAFHWQPATSAPRLGAVVQDALTQATAHRQQLHARVDRGDPVDPHDARRLLDLADRAIDRARLIADVCVGAFFQERSDKAREAERRRRQQLVERWLAGDDAHESTLRALAAEVRDHRAPFHWWLEFPEMDAFVGNPPFMGQSRISGELGPAYRDWLFMLHAGSGGKADLSAHFFRRAATLLGTRGALGLVATNTIAQGDTRHSGLERLTAAGWVIFDATRSLPWPGAAAVRVSVVCLASASLTATISRVLDDRPVAQIDSRLRPHRERPQAAKLAANRDLSFLGCKVGGQGFVLDPRQAAAFLRRDPRNAACIRPYLGGEEVNSHPRQQFSRHVIDFGARTLEACEAWPDLLAHVREHVKPYRDRVRRESWTRRWWQFAEVYPSMRAAVAARARCIVACIVTKHLTFSFQPTERVFSHKLYVFPLDTHTAFAVLQSRVHVPWAHLLSSTLGEALNYSASVCFDTFPFPTVDPRAALPALEAAGEAFYEARARYMLETDQGLTRTYNALKDPENTDPRVRELRRLTVAMDRAVLDAYGWTDLAAPPFCPRTDAERHAVQAFEDEVLDRLHALNAERAAEEARLGLRDDRRAKQTRRSGADGTRS